MFVKSLMIPKHRCHVIHGEDTVEKALELLEEAKVDGLPVLENDLYIGAITRYGIYFHYFTQEMPKETFLKTVKVKEIAAHQDKILEGEEIFEKTLVKLKSFPLLAVVDEKKRFLGIVTRYDVIEQFQSAFGTLRPGIRIAFTAIESEGRLARLANIIQSFHESVISLVTFDETDKLVRRIVLKIEKTDNLDKFITKLEQHGFRILDIHKD
ncbi:CBS domain-containing protein [Bacillus chungangensis]|uniref:CBS domain-containing protein n=1 Tax=Bacillus chungangensis TaxID=587633 RepID=A0ABT9WZ45_9BACI|nr:CBS domain-containing protein [Bacillus chungangensis]MDQ0178399.1 CBS domain-containing protein [Bacillus chungangensis]